MAKYNLVQHREDLQVDLDVEEDQQREGYEAQDEEPAPAVVARVDGVGPELGQLDLGLERFAARHRLILD